MAAKALPACNRSVVAVVNALCSLPLSPLGAPAELPSWQRKAYLLKQRALEARMEECANETRTSVTLQRRALPQIQVLRAVNAFNYTETIEAMLQSRLKFHRLSSGNKRWGKLATFLTKFRAFQHQIRNNIPWMIQLEEDVIPMKDGWREMTYRACALYERNLDADVMKLSSYAEIIMTSIDGARRLVRLLVDAGIMRSDDQQLLDPMIMGNRHKVISFRSRARGDGSQRPWILRRKTNRGHITQTRIMTWAEVALIRLLTRGASYTGSQSFGNPSGFDLWDV